VPVSACPSIEFIGTPVSGPVPLTVQFNVTDMDHVDSWNWSFGDGTTWFNTTDLLLRNATHPYTVPGTYPVSLWAFDFPLSSTYTRANYILATVLPPVAGFTLNPHSGPAPLVVQFNDTSTGTPTSWNWSFGDGTTWFNTTDLLLRNASHTYTSPGVFTISLTATSAGGSSQASVPLQVDAPPLTQSSGQLSSVVSGSDSDSDSQGSSPNVVQPVEPAASTESVTIGGASAFDKATVTGRGISDMVITAQPISSLPSSVPALDAPVYQYIEVTPARYSSVQSAFITFDVPLSWIEEQHSQPESVILSRYSGGAWTSLSTHVDRVANGRVYCTAESPGFSVFAIITVKGSAIGAGVARIAEPSSAQPNGTVQSEGSTHNTSPVSAVIPSGPTLIVPEQGPAPAMHEDSMVSLIPAIGAIFVIGITALLLAWRYIPQRKRRDKKL